VDWDVLKGSGDKMEARKVKVQMGKTRKCLRVSR
jgi:hypothetical protein